MIDKHTTSRWAEVLRLRSEQFDSAGLWFGRLLALMADLHGDDGCPWDREQSLASLRQYIREEADEVCCAIDAIITCEQQQRAAAGLSGDNPQPPTTDDLARTTKKGKTIAHHPFRPDFDPHTSASGAPLPEQLDKDELKKLDMLYSQLFNEIGDLLMQPVFLCEILSRMGRGGMERSGEEVVRKLLRRHPHVYGDQIATDSTQVLHNWEAIKQAERDAGDL